MKFRIASLLVLLMVLAVAVSFAQAKKDCPVTPTCCQKGSAEKASLSSKADAQDAKLLAVADKGEKSKEECKDMKNCDSKKECPMMKGEKTSMKGDAKDCCKDAKTTKSKAKAKKGVEKQDSDAKGSN